MACLGFYPIAMYRSLFPKLMSSWKRLALRLLSIIDAVDDVVHIYFMQQLYVVHLIQKGLPVDSMNVIAHEQIIYGRDGTRSFRFSFFRLLFDLNSKQCSTPANSAALHSDHCSSVSGLDGSNYVGLGLDLALGRVASINNSNFHHTTTATPL